jgi:hypothetical protein
MTKTELLEIVEEDPDLDMQAYHRYHSWLWEWLSDRADDANCNDIAEELGIL